MDVYQIYYMDSNNNKRVVSGGKSRDIAINALKGTTTIEEVMRVTNMD